MNPENFFNNKFIDKLQESARMHIKTNFETGFVIFNTAPFGKIYSRTITGSDHSLMLPSEEIFKIDTDYYEQQEWALSQLEVPENFKFSTVFNEYTILQLLDLHYHPRGLDNNFDYIIPSTGKIELFGGSSGDILTHFKNYSTNDGISIIGIVYQNNPFNMEYLTYQKKENFNENVDLIELANKLLSLAKELNGKKVHYSIGNRIISEKLNETGLVNSTIISYNGIDNKIIFDEKELAKFSFDSWSKLT